MPARRPADEPSLGYDSSVPPFVWQLGIDAGRPTTVGAPHRSQPHEPAGAEAPVPNARLALAVVPSTLFIRPPWRLVVSKPPASRRSPDEAAR